MTRGRPSQLRWIRTKSPASAARGEWWDPAGRSGHCTASIRSAHLYPRPDLPPLRPRPKKAPKSLSGLSVLDIGCGGGLVCEPLTRLGASVTGIDPARETIEAAKAHAGAGDLGIDYRATTAEACSEGKSYDAVLLLEVVEHVPDVPAFLKAVAPLVKPEAAYDSLDAEPHAEGLCARHRRR